MRRCLSIVVVVSFLLSGCTSDDERVAAADALAADLAAALTAQDLSGVPIRGGGQEQLAVLVAGMGAAAPQVSPQDVDVEDESATVTLAWQWPTPAAPWSYVTMAELTWAEDSWSVQWAPSMVEPTLGADEILELSTEQAQRGDIVGTDGVALITDRPVVRFGIDKTGISAAQARASARRLAGLVDVTPDAYAERVAKAGPKGYVEAVVLRKADAAAIRDTDVEAIPGAVASPGQQPLAPTRDFGAALLGRVGPATAEIIEGSDGSVRVGDQVGLSGLEARYEEQLGGVPGVTVEAIAGQDRRPLFVSAPVAGRPLAVTLDARLQRTAEAQLKGVDPPSAVVALRPSTGEILAAANGPGSQGYNTATVGQYPPGSTMKVVTALALIRAGVQPGDRIPCTPTVVVDGRSFTNYDDYPPDRLGRITLTSAVANSCNTALISQYDLLADDDLARAAAALGLGVDHDLGFPAYFGQVPVRTSKTGQAAALIGQGEVLASPMVMAAVAASVRDGRAVVPRLLTDRPVDQAPPDEPLSEQEAGALRDIMRAVVTDGSATSLADIPGEPVGAKTGTAEFGTSVPLSTHAWMIAFQGDLAVAAFVEEGQSGSQTAGPILEAMLRAAA